MNTNFKNNQNISSKTLLFSIAFLTLLATVTSCTADDLPNGQKISSSANVGDIIPPVYPNPPRN
jgi:hypothetical protein